jgi:hypothetical protein
VAPTAERLYLLAYFHGFLSFAGCITHCRETVTHAKFEIGMRAWFLNVVTLHTSVPEPSADALAYAGPLLEDSAQSAPTPIGPPWGIRA